MASERHLVHLRNQVNAEAAGVFSLDEDEDGDHVTLKFKYIQGEIAAKDLDFFAAMCQIRKELEVEGWRPICYGSSRNVYPSGMCRDMGRGLQAYKLQLGRRAVTADLVGIFDNGPDVEPASLEEQEQFWHEWLQSLGIEV